MHAHLKFLDYGGGFTLIPSMRYDHTKSRIVGSKTSGNQSRKLCMKRVCSVFGAFIFGIPTVDFTEEMLELLLFVVKDLKKLGYDMMIRYRRIEFVTHDFIKEVVP